MKIREKKQRAVALKYQPESDNAPKVIAKGRGKVAEKIIEVAKKNNVFIHDDPDLVEALSQLDIHEEIPNELYSVVAELLAFIYSINNGEKFQ
jgi:flagellar biosynthesis protein